MLRRYLDKAFNLACVILPWPVKRFALRKLRGFEIHGDTYVGMSYLDCPKITMLKGARIGHFNFIRGIEIRLEDNSTIGNLNRITGVPLVSNKHFSDQSGRNPCLRLGRQTSITSRHFIDCSDLVEIGDFTIVAGLGTQIFTHGIDLIASRLRTAPVQIGAYSLVGTGSKIVKGAVLPDRSVLAAGSVLAHAFREPERIYSGVPATQMAKLNPEASYFSRTKGFIP